MRPRTNLCCSTPGRTVFPSHFSVPSEQFSPASALCVLLRHIGRRALRPRLTRRFEQPWGRLLSVTTKAPLPTSAPCLSSLFRLHPVECDISQCSCARTERAPGTHRESLCRGHPSTPPALLQPSHHRRGGGHRSLARSASGGQGAQLCQRNNFSVDTLQTSRRAAMSRRHPRTRELGD